MADRELPQGWAIKHYHGEEGAIIKGPGVAQHIDGDRDDALTLFWTIWDGAQGAKIESRAPLGTQWRSYAERLERIARDGVRRDEAWLKEAIAIAQREELGAEFKGRAAR